MGGNCSASMADLLVKRRLAYAPIMTKTHANKIDEADETPVKGKRLYIAAGIIYGLAALYFLAMALWFGDESQTWTFVGLMISCISFSVAVFSLYESAKQAHIDRLNYVKLLNKVNKMMG